MFLLIVAPETINKDALASSLNERGNWMELTPGIYLIKSTVEPEDIQNDLQEKFQLTDNIWVTAVDTDASLPPSIAEWIREQRAHLLSS